MVLTFKKSTLTILYLPKSFWGITKLRDDIAIYLGKVGLIYFWITDTVSK